MTKRLYRSRQNRMLSGVSGGLAEYFEIDPVIVRALFIITTLGWGTGVLAYIILWIIVPQKPIIFEEKKNPTDSEKVNYDTASQDEDFYDKYKNQEDISNFEQRDSNIKYLFGAILIVIGILLLFNKMIPSFNFEYLWPVALIIFGILILMKTLKKRNSGDENENF